MPIRVRNIHFLHVYEQIVLNSLSIFSPFSFHPCVRRWGSEFWTGESLIILLYASLTTGWCLWCSCSDVFSSLTFYASLGSFQGQSQSQWRYRHHSPVHVKDLCPWWWDRGWVQKRPALIGSVLVWNLFISTAQGCLHLSCPPPILMK